MQSDLLLNVPGLTHYFGGVACPVYDPIRDLWERSKPIWKQVHGISVRDVEHPNQDVGEVDALTCFGQGLPIAVATADCVPIIMAQKQGRGIACVHAGWRGTRHRILRTVW